MGDKELNSNTSIYYYSTHDALLFLIKLSREPKWIAKKYLEAKTQRKNWRTLPSMLRKLLGGRHVILWKPELSEKLLYVIAQFFIAFALSLSSSTTKTPTNKNKKIRKPINQIQKKNHRRNRHTHKTKHIRNWNLGFLFDKAQVVNCFGGGCSWVSQCRLFRWRCCGSKKSLREGSERKVRKWEWERVAMAHEREQSNGSLQHLQVWFVFCDNSVTRNLGCQSCHSRLKRMRFWVL